MNRIPISSYSKAPRGLPVLSRVTCIFTGIKISPSLWSRQCPNRYTFRAGRNLPDKEFRYLRTVIVTAAVQPDKEFRYLRTVIVTAAVHWGFNSNLRIPTCVYLALLLTFQHWAGVSPYTSSFDLAETCVFGKQSLGPIHCGSIS